ncbi:Hypothetical predicted protein [Mytilus galloprovincialis]|uniref:E2 ubiquitin-conjugating enzyme n=1 Tax=Mytilus galloprovincialis TaxID=29158 RepID=A0A8B6EK50_MYTGA|nr:Hypothetical predicted protein [Mytilus galloprovincialis]
MAKKRLRKEFLDISQNPPPGISAGPIDDEMLKWNGMISAPDGSPYAGGVFFVEIQCPSDYPWRSPKVHFTTQIYHPNINKQGEICIHHLPMRPRAWTPACTIAKLLMGIAGLLADPNTECRFNAEASHLYRFDRQRYNETAAEFTLVNKDVI